MSRTRDADDAQATDPFAEERVAVPPAQQEADIVDATPEPATARPAPRASAPPPKPPMAQQTVPWHYWAGGGVVALLVATPVVAMLVMTPPPPPSAPLVGKLHLAPHGDRVGLEVVAGPHERVVVVSVDPKGKVEQWVPAEGGDSAPIPKGPDPHAPIEVAQAPAVPGALYVAVFDKPASEVIKDVSLTASFNGLDGVAAWADPAPGVDAAYAPR